MALGRTASALAKLPTARGSLSPGRVHRDAVFQPDDRTAAAGGRAADAVRDGPPGYRSSGLRPRGEAGLPRASCGDSVGILKTAGAVGGMPLPSLPAFAQEERDDRCSFGWLPR
jgi:hypothetical protein